METEQPTQERLLRSTSTRNRETDLGTTNKDTASGTVRSIAGLDGRNAFGWYRLRSPEICGSEKRDLNKSVT